MNNLFQERVCACALNRIFGFAPVYSARLIEHFGSARGVFDVPADEIDALLGPFSKYKGKICREALDVAEKELQSLEAMGCAFISRTEDIFPPLLLECEDAPAGLYVRSDSPLEEVFRRRKPIAIVGTRDISPYGAEWCPRIVKAMSMAPDPPTIVSGLAIGVDITAHLAALSFHLPTIAVLPTGIDLIYPKRHWAAAEKIAAAPGGALITDYPPGTQAIAVHFLRRNRIIAGMSASTVLIESKIQGGGTMTARLASSYGRDVFALPGRVDDIRSAGCNELIREQIAAPLTGLNGIGEALGLGKYDIRKKDDIKSLVTKHYHDSLPDKDLGDIVLIALSVASCRGVTPDELCRKTGLPYEAVSYYVGILESDGFLTTDLLQRCSVNPTIL